MIQLTDPMLLDSVLDELERTAPIVNRDNFDSERVKTLIAKGEVIILTWNIWQTKMTVWWQAIDHIQTDSHWLAEKKKQRRKGIKGLFFD